MTLIELLAHTLLILKDVYGDEFENLSIEAKQEVIIIYLQQIMHANHYSKMVIGEIFQKEFANA